MAILYICARGAQCGSPCDINCTHTHDFFKSKLFHDAIKPAGEIPFQLSNRGEWVEIDKEHPMLNLPDEFCAKPKRWIGIPYEYLYQIETKRKLQNAKVSKEDPFKNGGITAI